MKVLFFRGGCVKRVVKKKTLSPAARSRLASPSHPPPPPPPPPPHHVVQTHQVRGTCVGGAPAAPPNGTKGDAAHCIQLSGQALPPPPAPPCPHRPPHCEARFNRVAHGDSGSKRLPVRAVSAHWFWPPRRARPPPPPRPPLPSSTITSPPSPLRQRVRLRFGRRRQPDAVHVAPARGRVGRVARGRRRRAAPSAEVVHQAAARW